MLFSASPLYFWEYLSNQLLKQENEYTNNWCVLFGCNETIALVIAIVHHAQAINVWSYTFPSTHTVYHIFRLYNIFFPAGSKPQSWWFV